MPKLLRIQLILAQTRTWIRAKYSFSPIVTRQGVSQCKEVVNICMSKNFITKNPKFCNIWHRGLPRFDVQNRYGLLKSLHTTRPQKINPAVTLILRPVAKVVAVLVGRGFRKWWRSLPNDKRKLLLKHIIRYRWRYLVFSIVFGLTSYNFYDRFVCVTPYTGRKRFMIFNNDQLQHIFDMDFQMDFQKEGQTLLPSTHPDVVRTKRICKKLLQGNRDVPEICTKYWTIFVVDNPEENCEVNPSGHIVMNTGMLELTDNDDQIGMVLAHEISHVILEHTAEHVSYSTLVDILIFMPLALIWAFLPNDTASTIAHWVFKRVVHTAFHLPYSRKIEEEADAAGIFLAASACFDVREASAFWGRLHLIEENRKREGREKSQIPFLSTHPTNLERQANLDQLMTGALKTREEKKCPRLKKPDPRESVWALQQDSQTKKLAAITSEVKKGNLVSLDQS